MIAFYVASTHFNVLEKNTSVDKCMNKNYICYTLFMFLVIMVFAAILCFFIWTQREQRE